MDAGGKVWQYNGHDFIFIGGVNAKDIGIGADGTVWVISTDDGIYRQSDKQWTRVSGVATRIAVDPRGQAWVVNSLGQIYQYNGKEWSLKPGAARDLAIGAEGAVYVLGTDNHIWKWDFHASDWKLISAIGGGTDTAIAIGKENQIYTVNAVGEIHLLPTLITSSRSRSVDMKFVNKVGQPVEIYAGDQKVAAIGTGDTATIPINLGDKFLPKLLLPSGGTSNLEEIVITNLSVPSMIISLTGN